MPTMIELFQTLIGEILDVLLIPVPGALKGLGRVRAFAMFIAMEQALVEGGRQALLGEPAELLQGFADLADLLISGRLHMRLGRSVLRRHQHLYQRLSQRYSAVPEHRHLSSPQVLERMLGSQDVLPRQIEILLETSATSAQTLNQVWEGAPASASLVDAVHRLRADRLIDWLAAGADPSRPAPVDALDVMAPLLTQLEGWPAGMSLSIEDHQGLEVRRYNKDATRATTAVVTLTALEIMSSPMPRRAASPPIWHRPLWRWCRRLFRVTRSCFASNWRLKPRPWGSTCLTRSRGLPTPAVLTRWAPVHRYSNCCPSASAPTSPYRR